MKYSNPESLVYLNLIYESETLIIYVKDFGIGIPHKELKGIFKPFHRGSNIEGGKDMGIGMFIVKYYIALHNGTIEVESQECGRIIFKISLPIPHRS
jgi:K+-sensing histidine kinase KdpD